MRALLSATFYERGESHVIEVVHQRMGRVLQSLTLSFYDEPGRHLGTYFFHGDTGTIDLQEYAGLQIPMAPRRLMAALEARYDERVFPYRPHHYGFRRGDTGPGLYYAVNAVLGGVPESIGATHVNNVESMTFPADHRGMTWALLMGNLSHFAPAGVRVVTSYGSHRESHPVTIGPKAHVSLPIAAECMGHPLARVEVRSPFRLATYLVGRRPSDGAPLVYDHLFSPAR